MPDIINMPYDSPIFWSTMAAFALSFVMGYLLGSIPFGLIFTKLAGTEDPRNIGSGNIGATNVLRTGKKWVALATLVCDMFKGTLAVYLGSLYGMDTAIFAGLGAFIGHCYPIWLKFKGGKGVATYVGILIFFSLNITFIFAAIWMSVLLITRYSSLSALLASGATPIAFYSFGLTQLAEFFLLLTLILAWRHRENIVRLIHGKESKVGKSK